ncbi:MAG: exodeoxyribonuclease VII large subunit [Gammaproteobacteria bacterium TMED78]|nr:MAG: exodeoxyribonuclease VII large subunit [Gammaproteobacteria bacterium TMED78]
MYTNNMDKETINGTSKSIDQEIYTVSSLNRKARQLLEKKFNEIWIEGEISNLATPSSGHFYWSLKDSNSQVRCAMFRQNSRSISFPLEDGMQILVRGKISLYEVRGEFQVIVDHIEESGEGLLRKKYEELKKRLNAEGLFDEEKKKKFPIIPNKIGIITSPTGAAIKDVLSILKRRFPLIPIIIYPTSVQGKDSINEIVGALETADSRKECDVLILTRGGGSIEDLWSFNEEVVARAIAKINIPIIVGVGHEVDSTIADFVADKRAPTPSGAAELITPESKDLIHFINNQSKILSKIIKIKLNMINTFYSNLVHRLKRGYPGYQIRQFSQRIDDLENRSRVGILNKLEINLRRIDKAISNLKNISPKKNILRLKENFKWINNSLHKSILEILNKKSTRIKLAEKTLKTVSPLATLDRGYAIVSSTKDNTIVTNSNHLSIGSDINLILSKGEITAKVKKIKN